MALAGGCRLHLARRGDLEPLLGSRLRLHLGHFATPLFWFLEKRADEAHFKHKERPRHALPDRSDGRCITASGEKRNGVGRDSFGGVGRAWLTSFGGLGIPPLACRP